jgi:hypothetical protein
MSTASWHCRAFASICFFEAMICARSDRQALMLRAASK